MPIVNYAYIPLPQQIFQSQHKGLLFNTVKLCIIRDTAIAEPTPEATQEDVQKYANKLIDEAVEVLGRVAKLQKAFKQVEVNVEE